MSAAIRKRARRGAAARVMLAALMLCASALSSCLDPLELAPQVPFSCSNHRLDVAAGLYDEAKHFLDVHLQERDNLSLLYAYYASLDAEELTRTIRLCDDFGVNVRKRGTDLIRATRILRRVVVVNMRDPDPMVMIHLLGTKYDEVFKTDIR
jgi:hypothetical protein